MMAVQRVQQASGHGVMVWAYSFYKLYIYNIYIYKLVGYPSSHGKIGRYASIIASCAVSTLEDCWICREMSPDIRC